LKEPEGEQFARNQMGQIVEAQFVPEIRYGPNNPEPHRVAGMILSQYSAACWPIVGDALLKENAFMLSDLLRAHQSYEAMASGEPEKEVLTCVLGKVAQPILIPWCRKHPLVVARLLEFMGLFTTQQDGSFKWHPSAVALIEEFYQQDFKGTIFSNLASFSSTGSRVPYVERRINLLKQLETSANVHVRDMAGELIGFFEQDKEAQRKHDEEFKLGII